MKLTKAVITAASRSQRALPLQTLADRDGETKSVLRVLIEEALRAGIEQLCVVVYPGDEAAYAAAAEPHAGRLTFVPQAEPRGYGHAIYCAREFVGEAPFLHMIGDHVYVSGGAESCSRQLVAAAESQDCAVSAVQPTRENLLPYFGAVGGRRVAGTGDLYEVERVLEKPTPTEAEQSLLVPGLRAGHYLCFFGMHVLTPALMEILARRVQEAAEPGGIQLSPALAELATRERYLALEAKGRRYPLDVRYGLLTAQLALALSGKDREEVLSSLCELLAQQRPLSTVTAG
jgi:UTP--glucose-1-phosphate uridylyltransferase